MSRLKSSSIAFVFTALLMAAPSKAGLTFSSPEFVSDIVHRTYPLVTFIIARDLYQYSGSATFVDKLSKLGMDAAITKGGEEVARAAVNSGLVAVSSQAQGASSFVFFAAWMMIDSKYYLRAPLYVAVADRLGHAFRDVVNENAELIKGLAPQDKAQYALPAVRAAVPLIVLTTIANLEKTPGLGVKIMPVRFAYVASDLLSEVIMDHMKQGLAKTATEARFYATGILSGVGLVGILITDHTNYGSVAAEALLRSGFSTGLEFGVGPNDGKLKGATEMGLQAAAAVTGAILSSVSSGGSIRSRIQSNAATALMLPLAFSLADWTKEFMGHLYWRN